MVFSVIEFYDKMGRLENLTVGKRVVRKGRKKDESWLLDLHHGSLP